MSREEPRVESKKNAQGGTDVTVKSPTVHVYGDGVERAMHRRGIGRVGMFVKGLPWLRDGPPRPE